jgi:peptidoglycan/xylan/chitin deacetylase (PgdA/CDA1 family)
LNALLTRTDFDAWPGRLVRRLRRRHNDQCVNILTYHSVAKEGDVLTDGTGLRHHPAEFERQTEYLVEHYNPISLRELVAELERGETPQRAVVITFDDGYADSIRHALPILRRRRIPMTVFPVTSIIGNTDLMWQHKLAWLKANGHAAIVGEALKAEGFPPRDEAEPLTAFVRRCYRADLPEILEAVLRTTGRSGPRLAAALRPYLEPEEIAEADPEIVEFGNHTHTHPILSALSAERQEDEIRTARDTVLSLTGAAPVALAYPFGLKQHYNAVSIRIARETGHYAALDLRRRINAWPVDPFELSRKPAPSGSPIEFEKMIEDWPADAGTRRTPEHV